jgi:hypothetical protein
MIPLQAQLEPNGKGPYLKDQLPPDEGKSVDAIEWAAEGDEPKINCWMDIDTGPEGTEKISYMFISGAYLRSRLYVDFCEGGHFYKYDWIPEPQIWIEDILSVLDQVTSGVHEIHERYRMKYLGWRYLKAHESACEIERTIRDIALEAGTILPTFDEVGRLFALEGAGQDCTELARELMKKEAAKIPGGKK